MIIYSSTTLAELLDRLDEVHPELGAAIRERAEGFEDDSKAYEALCDAGVSMPVEVEQLREEIEDLERERDDLQERLKDLTTERDELTNLLRESDRWKPSAT